jgi:hypothetical protein
MPSKYRRQRNGAVDLTESARYDMHWPVCIRCMIKQIFYLIRYVTGSQRNCMLVGVARYLSQRLNASRAAAFLTCCSTAVVDIGKLAGVKVLAGKPVAQSLAVPPDDGSDASVASGKSKP